jgi:cytochrome c553
MLTKVARIGATALALCAGAATVHAQGAAPSDAAPAATADDLKKHPGRTAYLRKGACAACHGRDGTRGISYYPSIAGQDKAYIIGQINDILGKKRVGGVDPANNHPRTESMVGALVAPDGSYRVDPTDVEQIADWLSKSAPGKPIPPEAPIDAASAADGAKLYAKCVACHGKDGKKPLKSYPYLAGQKRIYLVQQMTDVRDGVRANGKIKVMLPFVKQLTDAQIGSLADYLSQIDRTAN